MAKSVVSIEISKHIKEKYYNLNENTPNFEFPFISHKNYISDFRKSQQN